MDLGSIPASALPSLQKGGGLWTLSCDFVLYNLSNAKMALTAAHLNAEVILVVTVYRLVYNLPLPPPPYSPPPQPPFSPSLISRTVSVDVKHHVFIDHCVQAVSRF